MLYEVITIGPVISKSMGGSHGRASEPVCSERRIRGTERRRAVVGPDEADPAAADESSGARPVPERGRGGLAESAGSRAAARPGHAARLV